MSIDSVTVSFDEDFQTLVSLFPHVSTSRIEQYLQTFTTPDRLALISNLLIDFQEHEALVCNETNVSAPHSSSRVGEDLTRVQSPPEISVSLNAHLTAGTRTANLDLSSSPCTAKEFRNDSCVSDGVDEKTQKHMDKGNRKGYKRLSTKSYSSAVQWLTEANCVSSSLPIVQSESTINNDQDYNKRFDKIMNKPSPRKRTHVDSLVLDPHGYKQTRRGEPSVAKGTENFKLTGALQIGSDRVSPQKSCFSKPTLRINGFGFDYGKAKNLCKENSYSPSKRSTILVQDDDLPKAKINKEASPMEDWMQTDFCVRQFRKRFPSRSFFELDKAKDLSRHIQRVENQLFSPTYDKSDSDDEEKWCYTWYWRATKCLNNVGKKFDKWSQEKIEQLYNIHSENPDRVKIMLRRDKKLESFQVHFWSLTMIRGHEQWYISRLKIRKNTPEQVRKDEFDCIYPYTWQPQSEDSVVLQVKAGGPEWNDVVNLFTRSLPPQYCAKVIDVQRVQNKWLWKKYYIRKKLLTEKNGTSNVNEKRLFHGTSLIEPRFIWKGEEGFDSRFSRDGMWGKGSYFAESSSYSLNYAHMLPNGNRQIFLANVLTGFNRELMPDSTLTMPPVRVTDPGGVQVRYNSVSGWTQGSKIYIVYQLDFAYPSYLITYSFVLGT